MKISLNNAGKRYNRDWIFRHINYDFTAGSAYAITGPNGSGKSTLLQALSGAISFNEGKAHWQDQQQTIAPENVYKHIAICAPYLELVEEFTLQEFLEFHQAFKPMIKSVNDIIEEIDLKKARHKRINQFSSGMKQRVKLAQCLFSASPAVLLDEPCTNLDAHGINLYHHLIHQYTPHRLVVVSSNDETEYNFCRHHINITSYKS